VQRWEESLRQSANADAAEAWLGMAEYAREQGDYQKAVDSMRRLEAVAPELARQKAFVLADSLQALGDSKAVVTLLESIEKTDGLPPWARNMLGQAYYQLKDYQRAVEQYQKTLVADSQSSVAHYGLSLAFTRLGRHDEAKQHREKYAVLQKDAMIQFDRMHGYGTPKDRHDPAKLQPVVARFHLDAARLYAQSGQSDLAETEAVRAWALAPDRPEPRAFLEALRTPSGQAGGR
jgi:tetratricopeptide (TPR) repeat protein